MKYIPEFVYTILFNEFKPEIERVYVASEFWNYFYEDKFIGTSEDVLIELVNKIKEVNNEKESA